MCVHDVDCVHGDQLVPGAILRSCSEEGHEMEWDCGSGQVYTESVAALSGSRLVIGSRRSRTLARACSRHARRSLQVYMVRVRGHG